MPTEPSLIQLSAYDPEQAISDDSPLADLAKGKPRQKRASAPADKKAELMAKFEASDDPKERQRLLDKMLKDEVG